MTVSSTALQASLLRVLATLLMCAIPTACVSKLPASNRPAPIGKELIDLDRARRDGLLDDAEHAALRAEVLRNFERIGAAPVEPAFPYRDGGAD